MTCLGITSSTECGSIALLYRNKIIKLASWSQKEQASEVMTAKIKSGLRKNKITFNDLTLIAVDKGPGSFTGSRIAVNVARTLAYTLQVPIVSFHSLEIMAFAYLEEQRGKTSAHLFTLIDAHKSLFYFQAFTSFENLDLDNPQPIQALSLDEIANRVSRNENLILVGNLTPKVFETLKEKIKFVAPEIKILVPKKKIAHFPQASSLVEMVKNISPAQFSNWADVEPTYIRSPDAVEKLNNLTRP